MIVIEWPCRDDKSRMSYSRRHRDLFYPSEWLGRVSNCLESKDTTAVKDLKLM